MDLAGPWWIQYDPVSPTKGSSGLGSYTAFGLGPRASPLHRNLADPANERAGAAGDRASRAPHESGGSEAATGCARRVDLRRVSGALAVGAEGVAQPGRRRGVTPARAAPRARGQRGGLRVPTSVPGFAIQVQLSMSVVESTFPSLESYVTNRIVKV